MTTFHKLPLYTLQQISGRVWRVARDGLPILVTSEANAHAYLDKWARGAFVTLSRRQNESAAAEALRHARNRARDERQEASRPLEGI